MSETLEARRARLAALEARDWVHVDCTRCGAHGVVAAPGQETDALCGGCRLVDASLAAAISRLPAETPPPMVWSGSGVSEPQEATQGVEVVACEPGECGHLMPGPVDQLQAVAVRAGWHTGVRHSVVGGVDWWSVRFGRNLPDGGVFAGYAVRRGDVWVSVCVTGETLPPFMALGVTELRTWLADPKACGEAWFAEVRRKVAAAELHAKQVRCPGPPRCVVAGPWTVDGVAPAPGEHTHRADGAIVKKVSRKEVKHGN